MNDYVEILRNSLCLCICFEQDNDYNKPIPAQFDEQLNQSVQNVRGAGSEFNSCSNVLCDNCSRNLLLKTRQLANFVPSSEVRRTVDNYTLLMLSYVLILY